MPPPTSTWVDAATRVLHARQSTVTVTPADSSDNSSSGTNLSGGAIAGIVIGSIAGFLLLLWIFKSCSNMGAPPQEKREPAWYDDVGAGRSRRRGRSRHSSRRGSYYVQEAHAPRRSRSREVRTVQPVVYTSEPRRPSRAHEKHRRRSRSEGRGYYV
ncbi:hypothetical protein N8I77_006185 [Diaporthe amygdali]|uniref:Uncharacterized protein n=1 Tax=Phomopsis amygdali TaxID=1214568 RepID=A0AAD9SH90_PHOAM|nr:Spherulin-4 [Diaporthe amygdali]KAJ0125204.1 Spherulin-4 [Diaporthe amygdali]KAK2607519.1 hypothetical protein N8I77_006185 [Diaporthe amygdali]